MRLLAAASVLLLGLIHQATNATAVWNTLPESPPPPKPLFSGYAEVNDIRMFYAIWGQGPPLLLLHGGLANSNYWSLIVPVLVQQGFKVIVADSRGHGKSTRSSRDISYELMTSDTAALLDHLGLVDVDIVGWSDGAIIGLTMAMSHPDRVRRVFAYGANSDPSGIKDGVECNPTFASYLERTRREYRELSLTPDDYDELFSQVQRMWAREPNFSQQQLSQIKRRVAIVDGAHEEAVKQEHTTRLAQLIPAAQLIILPDVSHFGMLQNPAEFAAAVAEFLNQH